ncbi:hypothetical protein BS78_10G076200 [Paspalum vaginatum]|nr:hypothetical protein BS78_10G076200 [Paspalum vaginatum]
MDLDDLDPPAYELLRGSDDHDYRESRASGTRAGSAADSSENEADSQSTSVDRKDGGASPAIAAASPRTASWASSTLSRGTSHPSCRCRDSSHGPQECQKVFISLCTGKIKLFSSPQIQLWNLTREMFLGSQVVFFLW